MTNTTASNENPQLDASDDRGGSILGHIWASIGATLVLGAICCGLYPLAVWAIGQAVFPIQANGSLVTKDGKFTSDDAQAVGSSLIGQNFSVAGYFHPRPSAAGSGYDASNSGGSNLGPLSAKLIHGTTKNFAFTIFAADKAHTAVVPVPGRVQGSVLEATKSTISLTAQGTTAKTTYTLDPAVADPNSVVNYHGRTIHATTIPVGSIVELTLNGKTPPAATAINVADQEIDAGISARDTVNNKITLDDSGSTVINVDAKNTAFIVNGKPAALGDLAIGMTVHVVVSLQMDFDGIADRVIHYCQDNSIGYKSSIPDSAFTDADGLDDVKLVTAFNAADTATITPAAPLPGDALTGSGSGLDPHISPENAELQAQRVADARKLPKKTVLDLIHANTDQPGLGFLGDPGVNVLMLNIALDKLAPLPAPAPAAPAAAAPAPAAAAPASK
jgi:K+-transporting ATPase KdpC subunit